VHFCSVFGHRCVCVAVHLCVLLRASCVCVHARSGCMSASRLHYGCFWRPRIALAHTHRSRDARKAATHLFLALSPCFSSTLRVFICDTHRMYRVCKDRQICVRVCTCVRVCVDGWVCFASVCVCVCVSIGM